MQRVKYKGLVNPKKTSFFNCVIQCLLHCPLARQTIENVPEHVLSIAMREIRILFKRMTTDDGETSLLPSECFHAILDTRECRCVQMYINERQEDIAEFLVEVLEHFEEELMLLLRFLISLVFSTTSILPLHSSVTSADIGAIRKNTCRFYLYLTLCIIMQNR